MFSKKSQAAILVIGLIMAALFFGRQSAATAQAGARVLAFDTMVGNSPAFTGATNPIRGINGGGLPWMLNSATGQLLSNGRLDIEVRGLVLAAGANAGSNPVAAFGAIVSCLGADGSVQNIATETFPATTGPAREGGGNARIRAQVALPETCIAPIIFVTSPAGSWFAATGK
jgi:hypothetical protein